MFRQRQIHIKLIVTVIIVYSNSMVIIIKANINMGKHDAIDVLLFCRGARRGSETPGSAQGAADSRL